MWGSQAADPSGLPASPVHGACPRGARRDPLSTQLPSLQQARPGRADQGAPGAPRLLPADVCSPGGVGAERPRCCHCALPHCPGSGRVLLTGTACTPTGLSTQTAANVRTGAPSRPASHTRSTSWGGGEGLGQRPPTLCHLACPQGCGGLQGAAGTAEPCPTVQQLRGPHLAREKPCGTRGHGGGMATFSPASLADHLCVGGGTGFPRGQGWGACCLPASPWGA